jgi:hypothetical protein
MRQVSVLLSRLLAILSAVTFLMAIALLGHSILTPQTHLPRLPEDGPSAAERFGLGGVCAAILLGSISYLLARLGSVREANRE